MLTNAWGIKYGDVEIHNEIDSIDNATFSATSTAPEYKDDSGKNVKASSDTNQNCNADFHSAGTFMTVNSHGLPRLLHDVTRSRLSMLHFRRSSKAAK